EGRPIAVARDRAVVIGRARHEPGDRAREGDVRGGAAERRVDRLRAEAVVAGSRRAGRVAEPAAGAVAVGIDGGVEDRGRRRDRGRGVGHDGGRGERGGAQDGAEGDALRVLRDRAIVIGGTRREAAGGARERQVGGAGGGRGGCGGGAE